MIRSTSDSRASRFGLASLQSAGGRLRTCRATLVGDCSCTDGVTGGPTLAGGVGGLLVLVAVGVKVRVDWLLGVQVADGVGVLDGVRVVVGVRDGVGVDEFVGVGVRVGVLLGVRVGEGVKVAVGGRQVKSPRLVTCRSGLVSPTRTLIQVPGPLLT
jgi:hypothetical protein